LEDFSLARIYPTATFQATWEGELVEPKSVLNEKAEIRIGGQRPPPRVSIGDIAYGGFGRVGPDSFPDNGSRRYKLRLLIMKNQLLKENS